MKILYAIQGTGNGHISRARAFIPYLRKMGELDLLVSGIQSDIDLDMKVKYRFHGMGFIFGKSGGVDFLNTYKKNKLKRFWNEVNDLPVSQYDIVINDFEPVSAWACQRAKIPCIGLSNQLAVLSPDAPKPRHDDLMGKLILRYYAPVTSAYGIHFQRYNEHIFTPVIREEIHRLKVSDDDHYTVYLPAYSDQRIIKVLNEVKGVKWQVFSKHIKQRMIADNVQLNPIDHNVFIKSLASSNGILCAAGFATPSEALYLGKKLMVIPMKNQYEQYCNAAALQDMGVPVIKSLKLKRIEKIKKWIEDPSKVTVDWPDVSSEIVQRIFDDHNFSSDNYLQYITSEQYFSIPA